MPIVHEGTTGNIVVIYHPFGSDAHFSQRHPEPHGTAHGCLASFRTPGSGDAIDSLARGPSLLKGLRSTPFEEGGALVCHRWTLLDPDGQKLTEQMSAACAIVPLTWNTRS